MLSKGARDGPLSPTMGITVQAPLLFSIPTRACSSFYRSGLSVTSSKPIYRLARLFPPSFSPIHASLSLPWSDRTPASMTEYRLLPPLPPPPVTPRHIEVDDDLILFLPPPPLLEHTFSLQSILSSLLSTVQPLPLSISFLLPTASFNYAVHTTPPPTPSHESYLLSEPFASLDFLYPLPPLHSSPFFLQLVQTLFLPQHTPLPPDLPSLHSATSAQRALLTHYTSFLHCQAYLPLPIVLVATLLTHRRASCASPTSPSTPNSRPCCRPLHPLLFFPSR